MITPLSTGQQYYRDNKAKIIAAKTRYEDRNPEKARLWKKKANQKYYQANKEEIDRPRRMYEWLHQEEERYRDWQPNQYISDEQYDDNMTYLQVIYSGIKHGMAGLDCFFEPEKSREEIPVDPYYLDRCCYDEQRDNYRLPPDYGLNET